MLFKATGGGEGDEKKKWEGRHLCGGVDVIDVERNHGGRIAKKNRKS